jgi:alpha/beta superfamily hydrolase
MPRRIESLFVDGPAGRLEALLEEPDDGPPREAALVCHPHPQHGGTMHNKVVYRIARGLRRSGAVVLRFNYRGVNLSEGTYDDGEGELEDARAALAYLRGRYPELPYTLAGFSFGSRIMLRIGCAEPGAKRVIAVGFPASYKGRAYLEGCTIPRIFIQSTHDQFCPVAEIEAVVAALPEPKRLVLIESQDHFFAGGLDQLEEAVSSLYWPDEARAPGGGLPVG